MQHISLKRYNNLLYLNVTVQSNKINNFDSVHFAEFVYFVVVKTQLITSVSNCPCVKTTQYGYLSMLNVHKFSGDGSAI